MSPDVTVQENEVVENSVSAENTPEVDGVANIADGVPQSPDFVPEPDQQIEAVGWVDAANQPETTDKEITTNPTTETAGDLNPNSVLSEFSPNLHVVSDEIIEETPIEAVLVGNFEIPEGQMMLAEGTRLLLGSQEIVLASEALIHWNSAEYALAGALALSGAENMRLNNKHLKLEYNTGGMLLPLANQPGIEDMPRFCSKISREEAHALGITEYEAYLRIWEGREFENGETVDLTTTPENQVSENLNT